MNAKIEIISNNIEATISSDIILDRHTQVSVASEIDVLKTYVKELEKSIQYKERKQKRDVWKSYSKQATKRRK